MKNLLAVLLSFFLIALSPVSHARPGEPLQSPQQAALVGSPPISRVHDVIIQAGGRRGWQVVSDNPGEFTLHNTVRGKHEINVNVFYDSNNVRIEYVSSSDLDYRMEGGAAYIHPKYNEWVKLLLKDIVKAAQ